MQAAGGRRQQRRRRQPAACVRRCPAGQRLCPAPGSAGRRSPALRLGRAPQCDRCPSYYRSTPHRRAPALRLGWNAAGCRGPLTGEPQPCGSGGRPPDAEPRRLLGDSGPRAEALGSTGAGWGLGLKGLP